jgi:hypothetical protein
MTWRLSGVSSLHISMDVEDINAYFAMQSDDDRQGSQAVVPVVEEPTTAVPLQSQDGPIKPEALLDQLQKLRPDVIQPFENEEGIICIGIKDFFKAVYDIDDIASRSRVTEFHKRHPVFYDQIVRKTRNPKGK